MKKIIAIILCIVLISLSLSACSFNIGKILPGKNNSNNSNNSNGGNNASNNSSSDNSGNNDSGNSWFGGEDTTEIPTNPDGFVDSSYAVQVFETPANPENTLNSVADPSGDSLRFVFDETGRIAKCYYTVNGVEIYLNYKYGEAWVEIFGFIGETLVCDEVIQLPGEFNPDVGISSVRGYYIKGYTF